PLPSPPTSLSNNAEVQTTLEQYAQYIQVKTPFDVDRLGSFLSSHPNRPFVDSVLLGLRDGFWPLSDKEWSDEMDARVGNYPMEEIDLEAVRIFRDKEVEAGQWSEAIPKLGKGMKTSPMFVVWQNNKPRVITDHTASGLNDSISREQSHVRYDNMQDFGQSL
ncbi:hypothetical protein BC835DRAFT_1225829, partial [Cytidiella melzeri]